MNVVRKYGRNSIDSEAKIQAAARHLAEKQKPGESLLVVISGSCYGKPGMGPGRTLAEALSGQGVDAAFYGGLGPEEFPYLELEQLIKEGKSAVVEGPETVEGKADPVRSGAETLAVVLAAELGLDCEIYTDVDGVYSVDPKLYPQAKRLPMITYEDMMELAALGTGALEARSVELAKRYDVRLYITEALAEDHGGTYIMNDSTYMKDMAVTGIATADDYTIVTVSGMEDDGVFAAELFEVIGGLSINVDMISKQIQPDGRSVISFSCPGGDGPCLRKKLEMDPRFQGAQVSLRENLAMVSLVGVGMAIRPGVAGKVFSTLRKAQIPCFQITTSEITISLAIDMENKDRAVSAFSRAFEL